MHLAVIGQNHEIKRMLKLDSRSVDNTAIDKGFSLVFDNFLGEDIKVQKASALGNRENEDPNLPPYNKAEQDGEEGSSGKLGKGNDKLENTDTSHQGRSFGVPSFQEQSSRDFKKFELHPENKDSGESAVVENQEKVKYDINILIVMATLIATVSFTAALAPEGYGEDGKVILRDNTYFRWFQTFNLMSFVFSLWVLLYESFVPHLGSKQMPLKPGRLIVVSLYGMLFALTTGIEAGQTRPRKSMSADPWISLVIVAFIFLAICPSLKEPILKEILRKKAKIQWRSF